MWQLVQPKCFFFHMFFQSEKEFENICEFDLAALCVYVFVFKSSPSLLKPSACSSHSLYWSGPLGPRCPPTLYRGAPPLHPGSPPLGAFSSFLPLILQHLLLPAQSPPLPHPRPPLPPPCPGWLSQCRWTKGRKACGVAQPGWEPED